MKKSMLIAAVSTLALIMHAGSLQAAIIIATVSDDRPGEISTLATTTAGSVNTPAAVPTATYIVSGLDLTSYGGGSGESIAFDVAYTFGGSGGTAVQINGYGNISVTGGDNNQVDDLETITATVGFNEGSSTFTGDFSDLSIGFTSFTTGGVSSPGTDEFWDITTESGTQSFQSPTPITTTFAASSYVTLDPVAGNTRNGTFNVQGFDVQISIPEPASFALVALGGLVFLRRRHRA